MSFASYERLPPISNYMTAKLRLSVTQPIRKTGKVAPLFTRYPLSSTRRDTNFLIRRAGDEASKPVYKYEREFISAPNTGDEDIQLMLYGSPVITFHADTTEFTIFQGMYSRWSAADCSFFRNILYRYFKSVSTTRGHLVMTDYQGGKYVLQNKFIRFQFDEANRTVTPVDTDNLKTTALRLNRKATNIVRARYGEFYRYMKGMVGVRKEPSEHKYYDHRVNAETVVDLGYQVKITQEEWMQVVPTAMEDLHRISGKQYRVIQELYRLNSPRRKPPRMSLCGQFDTEENHYKHFMSDKPYQEWLKVTEELLALASTPATDPSQTENFYKAFVWLAFYCANNNYRMKQDLTLHADDFGKTMDEIIFKYHSEEVFERVPIKPNTVPNMKYEKWVTRESESE